jgi:photosystem II stability/assembly factor-like uncharacterized protein
VHYISAAWCGPCNPSFSSGGGFRAGVATLSDAGGSWHVVAQECTGASVCGNSGLPNRYISGVKIDNADPTASYAALSGYSRKWIIGPDDPGVGHVFRTANSGATWTDVSGNLPDIPMDDIVVWKGQLVVGTDTGVFVSSNGGGTWSRLGTNLPNVVIGQLTVDPNGTLIAATHGRGIWTLAS